MHSKISKFQTRKFFLYVVLIVAFGAWAIIVTESTILAIDQEYTFFEHWVNVKQTLSNLFRIR